MVNGKENKLTISYRTVRVKTYQLSNKENYLCRYLICFKKIFLKSCYIIFVLHQQVYLIILSFAIFALFYLHKHFIIIFYYNFLSLLYF
jgi:hypothetical protein